MKSVDELLTLREFEQLPDESDDRLELARGRLVREPPPAEEHGWVTSRLFERLVVYGLESGRGIPVNEMGFLLADNPPTVRQPDLAFILKKNLPAKPLRSGFRTTPPDIAIEVVSPSNRRDELEAKVWEYLAAGTLLVWLVNPHTRRITVYRSPSDIQTLTEDDVLEAAGILPGFCVDVSDLFAL